MIPSAGLLVRPSPRPAIVPLRISNISFIVWCTAIHVGLGLASLGAWAVTGNWEWVRLFFKYPAAIFLIEMAALELKLSRAAWRNFSTKEPLATGWMLITASAACHLAGAVCTQVLSADTVINPLARASFSSPALLRGVQDYGLLLAGPAQMVLLALGLARVLSGYGKCGLLKPMGRWTWLAVGIMAVYAVREVYDVSAAVRSGAAFRPGSMVAWASDPLLIVLIAEASCLYRSSKGMGRGLIARCWVAYAAAVFLTYLGDAVMWATCQGHLPWKMSYVNWYVWFPAAAAYALGPAWQVDAMVRAARPGA